MKNNQLRVSSSSWVFTLLAEQEGFLSHFLMDQNHCVSTEAAVIGLTVIASSSGWSPVMVSVAELPDLEPEKRSGIPDG
jgi:hypothetical protein